MTKIKHSKFKNTGILFELLVRQVTADILNGTDEPRANKILQKFFKESTELGKELKLYQLLINEKAKDSVGADRIVEAILSARKRLSDKRLNEQKYNLIKEVKNNYPIEDFLRGKISNYKLLASAYKLFESCSNDTVDVADVISSRNLIMESLLGNTLTHSSADEKDRLLEYYKRQEKDLRILSYKMLVDRFNEKYACVLNEEQKILLREYINNVSNTNSLKKYINQQIPLVQAELTQLAAPIKDKVVKIKISETVRQLDKLKKGSVVKDSQVTALLQSYELIKELKTLSNNEPS